MATTSDAAYHKVLIANHKKALAEKATAIKAAEMAAAMLKAAAIANARKGVETPAQQAAKKAKAEKAAAKIRAKTIANAMRGNPNAGGFRGGFIGGAGNPFGRID